MFPIRDDNPHFLTPYVTYGIIALNVVAWVFAQGLGTEPALSRSVCLLGLTPGELLNTLRRLAVWSDAEVISEQEVQDGLLTGPGGFQQRDAVLEHELGQGFELTGILEQVEKHYVAKAWLQSGQRKKEAARLLGMTHYQTFGKRLEKYGLHK